VTEPLVRWVTGEDAGAQAGAAAARRPGHVARDLGFRAAVELLRAAGRPWPRL
jgi:hypothetical protein